MNGPSFKNWKVCLPVCGYLGTVSILSLPQVFSLVVTSNTQTKKQHKSMIWIVHIFRQPNIYLERAQLRRICLTWTQFPLCFTYLDKQTFLRNVHTSCIELSPKCGLLGCRTQRKPKVIVTCKICSSILFSLANLGPTADTMMCFIALDHFCDFVPHHVPTRTRLTLCFT